MVHNKIPLPVGQRFHRLIVLAEAPPRKRRYWLCRCDCGREKEIMAKCVVEGSAQSCGCLRRKHGLIGTPEYRIWMGMRNRCLDPHATHYDSYGGRGITICPQWGDFSIFLHDVGARPSMRHTLDRVDNNGNYEPGNVRWATRREQGGNRRDNRVIAFGGQEMILSDWARRLELPTSAMIRRLRKWPLELALTLPRGTYVKRRGPK